MNIKIPYKIFKQRLKLRYPLISIIVILMIIIVPYFVPIDKGYSPVKSFNNTGDYGQSKVASVLKSQTSVTIAHLDITNYHSSDYQALIIISADKPFKPNEIDFLKSWVNSGKKLVLIGTTKSMLTLYTSLFQLSTEADNSLLDYQTKHDNVNYVDMIVNGVGSVFTSVSPLEFDSNSLNGINIHSVRATEKRLCIARFNPCLSVHNIGIVGYGVTVLLDDWMLRNKFVNQFPDNVNLLPTLLNLMGANEKVLVDESHYYYAPLNRQGVEAVLGSLKDSAFYRPVILVFAIILPILLGFLAGIFNKQDPRYKFGLGKKLMERLDRLYLDKIVAAPLSLEEQILVNEKLEVLTRKHNYFQYVARLYLNYLQKKNMLDYIPQHLLLALQEMEIQVISNQDAWYLISIINFEIDKAKQKQRNQKDTALFTSRIPGTKEVL